MKFLVFSSNSFMNRTKVCIDSITKYHPEAEIQLFKITSNTLPGNYLEGLAKFRIQKALELIENGEDNIIVIGSDCVLYDRIDSFLNLSGDVVLIPHVVNPPQINSEFYKTGHVNADLMLFRKNSKKVLNWLLKQEMTNNIQNGIFYEQTALSSLPFIFDNITICKDPAINFAYYNFEDNRSLTKLNDKYYINGNPLKMVQFSGFIENQPEIASKYYSGTFLSGDHLSLFEQYNKDITK